MAFGASSAIFQQAMLNPVAGRCWTTAAPTTYSSLSADTIDCALFGNSVTPDKTAAVASTGYNTGTWTTGNETSGTGYSAGGSALASKAFAIDTGSSSICFTAANVTWSGATITAYGCLIYDATITAGTVAKQGLCYNSFGGSAQTVSGGTFTIQWATPGGAAVTAVFNISV
jgi:hypothetical protein